MINVRIGVICSSNGGVIRAVTDIINQSCADQHEMYVITDRDCGIEDFCRSKKVNFCRIADSKNDSFSQSAKEYFDLHGVEFVLLFFTRLIHENLFCHIPVFNIHPSLLPAFTGFRPIERAVEMNVKFLGATLHLINDKADSGSIIAQNIVPIITDYDINILHKISFLQKTYLSLLLIELMEHREIEFSGNYAKAVLKRVNNRVTASCNPALNNEKYSVAFNRLQMQEGIGMIL